MLRVRLPAEPGFPPSRIACFYYFSSIPTNMRKTTRSTASLPVLALGYSRVGAPCLQTSSLTVRITKVTYILIMEQRGHEVITYSQIYARRSLCELSYAHCLAIGSLYVKTRQITGLDDHSNDLPATQYLIGESPQ